MSHIPETTPPVLTDADCEAYLADWQLEIEKLERLLAEQKREIAFCRQQFRNTKRMRA